MLEKALVKQAEVIDKCRYNLDFKGYHLPNINMEKMKMYSKISHQETIYVI